MVPEMRRQVVGDVLAHAPGYVFDPNPVFWALGPRTLHLTLTRACGRRHAPVVGLDSCVSIEQEVGMDELSGRIGVVTGAASGIGLGAAERFLANGMKVVLADVEPQTLDRQVKRLSEAGGDVLGVVCDVREPSEVYGLAERTLSHYGGVHVVMNNAGVAPAGPMLETKPADWRWIVDVNLLGVAYGVTAFGPILRDAGEGHIINTASEAGLVSSSVLGMYTATKHAVVGLTEALYRELEGTGVGVHCLCPNLVNTRIFESERNRDDGVEMSAAQTATIAPLREATTALGIETEQVAVDVIDAIRRDRFWIFTHEVTPKAAAVRFADIEAGRNPTNPYEDMEPPEGLGELR
jgi:NAD(P)-dependent dehydrogenase (short-subunit alcohol dehydrogenase family)